VIIADSMSYRFAVPVMLGAEAALSEIDLSVIACDARGDRARSLELARMLAARKVDGMLLVGDNNAVTASVTRHVDVPVVYVYGESSDPEDVVHMPNDSDGIGLAAGHLVAAGRRALAHLTGPRRADNWPVFALESEPQLTTVDMNLEALGAAAARELFMIIDGEARPGGVRWHDCDLVIRGSAWPGQGHRGRRGLRQRGR
jgi:DNA-binding LacI/PurR family transcriptional regulator